MSDNNENNVDTRNENAAPKAACFGIKIKQQNTPNEKPTKFEIKI